MYTFIIVLFIAIFFLCIIKKREHFEQNILPIIFMFKTLAKNKSKSKFLFTVLKCARYFNPQARIILLGDSGNKEYTKNIENIEHYNIDDYGVDTKELIDLNKYFKVIKGKNGGSGKWAKFLFERYIRLYYFLKKENIGSFWTFDCDTMIIDDLSNHQYKFKDLNNTEQCNSKCINGFVKSPNIIYNYMISNNNMFKNTLFLNETQKSFDKYYNKYMLTEMGGYVIYKYGTTDVLLSESKMDELNKINKYKSLDLSTPINNETFDHCLCQNMGPNNDKKNTWEMEFNKIAGKNIKKLYFKDKKVYLKFLKDNKKYRAVSLNLSWVPLSFFDYIFDKVT